jgi:hypothetical protein
MQVIMWLCLNRTATTSVAGARRGTRTQATISRSRLMTSRSNNGLPLVMKRNHVHTCNHPHATRKRGVHRHLAPLPSGATHNRGRLAPVRQEDALACTMFGLPDPLTSKTSQPHGSTQRQEAIFSPSPLHLGGSAQPSRSGAHCREASSSSSRRRCAGRCDPFAVRLGLEGCACIGALCVGGEPGREREPRARPHLLHLVRILEPGGEALREKGGGGEKEGLR